MKFQQFLNESTDDKSTGDDSLTPKQRRAVKLYNTMKFMAPLVQKLQK